MKEEIKKFNWKVILEFLIMLAIGMGMIILTVRISRDMRKEEIKEATLAVMEELQISSKKTTTEKRLESLEKDFDALKNYYCLEISHYTDGGRVVGKWPWPNAGQCQKGFVNY
jgi:uncharacterized protein YpmS